MFQTIRNWLDRRIIERSTITPSQWSAAFAALPLLHGLREDEKRRLRELAILFLDRKAIEGAHELAVTQSMALIIALQPACDPGAGARVLRRLEHGDRISLRVCVRARGDG